MEVFMFNASVVFIVLARRVHSPLVEIVSSCSMYLVIVVLIVYIFVLVRTIFLPLIFYR